MKLLEALEIIRKPVSDTADPFTVFLGCGFTPLYLKTYLHAHLRRVMPERSVTVETALFGDLAGELERIAAAADNDRRHGCVVVVEWPDLDERLGYRSAGGWRVARLGEILDTVEGSLTRLAAAIEQIATRIPVVVSVPALSPAPFSFSRPDHGSRLFWDLQTAIVNWARRLSADERITVLNPQWMDACSPAPQRADIKSNLASGYPYSLEHTDALASGLVSLLVPAPPAKAVITDLDDTLWSGILGDAGVDGVGWSLETKSQTHGLYQQLLQSLADSGVLVGVASKNDPQLVEQVWRDRSDLLIESDALFPREIGWGAKSESVSRILRTWNIGADAAIFIDDSPMEVAEVMEAHPGIRGIVFPKNDPVALIRLFEDLRLALGKRTVTDEDKLRSRSLQVASDISQSVAHTGAASEDFLRAANAVIRIDCTLPQRDGRALELVNKTNQFNLNGIRYIESELSAMLRQPDAFVCIVSYEDRFGPLGRIAVLAGSAPAEGPPVAATWVMSCRAFSRRIEHACLRFLFDYLNAPAIQLSFIPTHRNGPLQDFLHTILDNCSAESCIISRQDFDARCPALYHQIVCDAPAKAIPAS